MSASYIERWNDKTTPPYELLWFAPPSWVPGYDGVLVWEAYYRTNKTKRVMRVTQRRGDPPEEAMFETVMNHLRALARKTSKGAD